MTRLINADGADVTQKTLEAIKKAMGGGAGLAKAETVTTANGLVAYDLEAPAKNLYPVLTPIRNRLPRDTKSVGAGVGPHWMEVSAITGSGVPSMPWVPEGQRAARMSITATPRSASYVTIGEESDVTFEAQGAGQGFEDVMATNGMRLLQAVMLKEEVALLGGNRSVALGTPATPVVTVDPVGGTIDAGANTKVHVRVFGLTMEGYLAATLSAGIARQTTVTGQDAKTFTINGGSSKASLAGNASITGATNSVSATVTAKKGAVAYAWYVGLDTGAESLAAMHLEAITTINSVNLTALVGTYQALSATGMSITSDYSYNDGAASQVAAFDGLLYSAFNSSLAYHAALATGTAGTGTGLTASGRGTVAEIDTMLKGMWDSYRLSPEEIYVNAQELSNITMKSMLASGGSSILNYFNQVQQRDAAAALSGIPQAVAGVAVGYYLNPFTVGGGQIIPIKLHPNLPAGTIMAWAQNLPAYYQSANVPQTASVQCRRDYYQIPWPLVTRANETGVYAEEVLKCYAPFAIGVITNIGNA